MQVFCYTYGGTELILESQNMVNAVYSSDWTAATPKQRKSLQIIMLRGQFICRIRVRLFEVSLVTLSKVSWGMYFEGFPHNYQELLHRFSVLRSHMLPC